MTEIDRGLLAAWSELETICEQAEAAIISAEFWQDAPTNSVTKYLESLPEPLRTEALADAEEIGEAEAARGMAILQSKQRANRRTKPTLGQLDMLRRDHRQPQPRDRRF